MFSNGKLLPFGWFFTDDVETIYEKLADHLWDNNIPNLGAIYKVIAKDIHYLVRVGR